MRQYCFNGTADLRLLWELRAGMRTGERMCGDLRTESFLSFFLFLKCAVDWIPLRGGRLLFVCFMTADKRRSSTAPVFANGFSLSSYSCCSMAFFLSHWTGVSAQNPADKNATLITGVIIIKFVAVSGAVGPWRNGYRSGWVAKWVYTMLSEK